MPIKQSNLTRDPALTEPSAGKTVAVAAVALLVVATAAADRVFPMNVSILYLAPMVVVGRLGSRRWLWVAFALLSALTVFGFLIGPHQLTAQKVAAVPVNRVFVVAALLAIVLRPTARTDAPETDFSGELEESGDGAGWDLLLCIALVGCTFLIDLFTPAQYNLPILYAVPLTISTTFRRPWLMWVMLVLLLIGTVIGYVVTPPTVPQPLVRVVLQNRLLAAAVLVLIAILARVWCFCRHVWIIAPEGGSDQQRRWVCLLCHQVATQTPAAKAADPNVNLLAPQSDPALKG